MYKDLSLKEKAKVLLYGGKLGLTSVEDIAKLYDEAIGHKYVTGGPEDSPKKKAKKLIENTKDTKYDPTIAFTEKSLIDANIKEYDKNTVDYVSDFFNSYANSEGANRIKGNQLLWYSSYHPIRDRWYGRLYYGNPAQGANFVIKSLKTLDTNGIYEVDAPVANSKSVEVGNKKAIIIGNEKDKEYDTPEGFVLPHELIHRLPDSKLRGAQADAIDRNNNTIINGHDELREEKYSDLQGLRLLLYNEGIYDSRGTKDATPEDIQKLRDIYPNLRPLILMDNEKAAWMINHVVQNNTQQEELSHYSSKGGPIVSPYGQWKYPGRDTIIPSNNITMDNVNYPVLGISDTGDTKIMMPWNDYKFRGSMVYEHPLVGNLALEGKKFNKEWKALDNILYNVYPDTSFTREKTGVGDIEVFNKENGDTIIYPNSYRYINPYPGLNTIVYNPDTNDALDIRLDALHLMPLDATYDALNTLYRNNALGSDVYYIANKRYEEDKRHYGKDNIDLFSQYYNNEADALLRNMFIEGTPEYIKAKRYYPNKQQLREWNINLLPYINEIQEYLETGERPKYILPEVVITPDKYKKGGHFAQIGRKLRLPNRINRNTSSTLELSEDYETEMRLRISGADPQYLIPYIPDKSILINGSTTSTNVLDSIVKYAGIHNRDLKPAQNPAKANPKPRKIEPYEAIGLGILETHLGAIPAMSIKRPSEVTDDEWKLMLRAWYNANQFTAYGDIPSYALLNNYHWLDTNGSVHPLLDAMRYYSLGDYNTGDKNHTNDVKNAGLKVWRNLNIQDWWNNSGKYVYEGKPTPEQATIVEFLKVDPLNYDRNGVFQYDSFGNPIKALGGNLFKKGGIYIKPENRGKFTALKKRTGHSASWFKAHGTPALKKMATFALNARKWHNKHNEGGYLYSEGGFLLAPYLYVE